VQQSQCQEQPKYNPTSNNATVTRIQFRLPSGNSYTGQFEPSNTLRTLRTYVTENIDLPFRQFAMSTSFPRRELTNEENDKTLLELELVPTAVILILPLKNVNEIRFSLVKYHTLLIIFILCFLYVSSLMSQQWYLQHKTLDSSLASYGPFSHLLFVFTIT